MELTKYVYITTNLVNSKKYIGVCLNVNKYKADSYLGSGKLLKLSILKHGRHNFRKEIIKYFDDEKSARQFERELIFETNAVDSAEYYNLAPGGFGGAAKGHMVSNETREKLRKINNGKKMSVEAVDKMRKALSGRKQKLESIERRRIGIQKAWQNMSETTRKSRGEKIGIKHKGKLINQDMRAQLSQANALFTKEDVLKMIFLRNGGATYQDIANEYNITKGSAWEIINKKSYKWIWN